MISPNKIIIKSADLDANIESIKNNLGESIKLEFIDYFNKGYHYPLIKKSDDEIITISKTSIIIKKVFNNGF